MSKGLGQKITVKFTEDLNEVDKSLPTHKYLRWQIDTKWSSYIYLYGIEIITEDVFFLPSGIISAIGQYSSYEPARAFDGSTSTYWRPNTYPCWIQIELPEAVTVKGFRWNTQTTSYRPRGFKLLGSNDGESWEELYSDESPAVSYWKNFSWDVLPYITNSFKVTGQEYKYVNGPLLDKEYQIVSVENHPTVDKALLLTMHPLSRFPTVEGNLTVEYDATVGNLAGRGGPVESFIETFTPTDLVPEPNPGIEETVTVAPAELLAELVEITYSNGFAEETLSAAPAELTVDLVYVGVINP